MIDTSIDHLFDFSWRHQLIHNYEQKLVHHFDCFIKSKTKTFRERKFSALKVVKSAPHYTETALDEIKLLKCVSTEH